MKSFLPSRAIKHIYLGPHSLLKHNEENNALLKVGLAKTWLRVRTERLPVPRHRAIYSRLARALTSLLLYGSKCALDPPNGEWAGCGQADLSLGLRT